MSKESKKKTFEFEIEVVSTHIVYVDAINKDKATELVYEGGYDLNAQESKEVSSDLRDIVDIKEFDKEENFEGL